MSVFSNEQIRQGIKEGHIICNPYNPMHVNHASLDVTLGHYYYRLEQVNERTIFNPFDREEVERYFDGPFKAIPHKIFCDLNNLKTLNNIPDDHPVIALKPGERILAHTHEFIGIIPPGAYELKSRSSWGRNGIAVCFDAGWVDPGYINRLTLGIFNLNQRETILLPVGERIAQAIFHQTGPVQGSYGDNQDNGFSGKYQQSANIKTIISTWAPEQMLPRAYLDHREAPKPVEGTSYD
jgi:deoxycytidine triphosphate deaminase